MKTVARLLIFVIFVTIAFPEEACRADSYSEFQSLADRRRQEIGVESLAYVVGGTLGLASSIGLSIQAKELLPKIGNGVIQILSASAIAYGITLRVVGDDLTQQAEELRAYGDQLRSVSALSESERSRLLDLATDGALARVKERRRKARKIRGVLELVTAGAAGASLVFNQIESAPLSIGLGLVALISGVSGVTDLVGEEKGFSPANVAIGPPVQPSGLAIAVNFNL